MVHTEPLVEPAIRALRQAGRSVPDQVSVVAICPDEIAERRPGWWDASDDEGSLNAFEDELLVVSGVYETPPWPAGAQAPPYLNAAVLAADAGNDPYHWLARARDLEAAAGQLAGADAHEPVLGAAVPRAQRQALGLGDLLACRHALRVALRHDAPRHAGRGVEPVHAARVVDVDAARRRDRSARRPVVERGLPPRLEAATVSTVILVSRSLSPDRFHRAPGTCQKHPDTASTATGPGAPTPPQRAPGPPGSPLPQPVRVRLVDLEGGSTERLWVLWVVVEGSGTVEPRHSFTDADGVAEATWTLGSGTPRQRIEARAVGETEAFEATLCEVCPEN